MRPNLLGVSGLIVAALLHTGCASQPEQTAPAEAEVAKAEAAEQQGAEVKAATEEAREEANGASEQNADALMASLAASSKPAKSASKPVAKAEPKKAKAEPVEKKVAKAKPAPKAEPVKKAAEKLVEKPKVAEAAPKKTAPVAAAPAPEPKAGAASSEPLDIKLSDLPVKLDLWSIRKSLQGDGLLLTTPTWEIGAGSHLSQIWLTLEEQQLSIHSASDIDPEAKGSGVSLNGSDTVPFSRIDDGKIAVLEGDWMKQFADGGTLEIHMGFFPGKTPRSPTFKTDAPLDALMRLVPTYEQLKN